MPAQTTGFGRLVAMPADTPRVTPFHWRQTSVSAPDLDEWEKAMKGLALVLAASAHSPLQGNTVT